MDICGERCFVFFDFNVQGRHQLVIGKTSNEGLGALGRAGNISVEPRAAF